MTSAESTESNESVPRQRWPKHAVWIGLVTAIAGFLSYFLYFFQFPTLRDSALLNIVIVLFGAVVSLVGWRGVLQGKDKLLGKAFASLGCLLAVAIAGLFNFYVFSFSFDMPVAQAAPAVGSQAPDFTLTDHTGTEVSLADMRSENVVLSFYRGSW